MKNKTIIPIILGVFLLASVSAMYAGDSYSFPSEQFEYYTVVGNSSNLNGMNVSWENGNTTINFQINFAPDNFTLVFFNQEEKIVKEYHYSHSSGGGHGINQDCTEWSECIDGFQNRTCDRKVLISRSCGIRINQTDDIIAIPLNNTPKDIEIIPKEPEVKDRILFKIVTIIFILFILFLIIKSIKEHNKNRNEIH